LTDYDRILPDHIPEQLLPGRQVQIGDLVLTVKDARPDAMYSGPEEYDGYDIALAWVFVCSVDSGVSPDYADLYGAAGQGVIRGDEKWVVYVATAGKADNEECVYLYVVQLRPAVAPVLDRILS
jgi:hypothetical protein